MKVRLERTGVVLSVFFIIQSCPWAVAAPAPLRAAGAVRTRHAPRMSPGLPRLGLRLAPAAAAVAPRRVFIESRGLAAGLAQILSRPALSAMEARRTQEGLEAGSVYGRRLFDASGPKLLSGGANEGSERPGEERKTVLDGATGHDLYRLIGQIQESEARDAAIQSIPGKAYERMDSASIAAILSLVSASGSNHWGRRVYQGIPMEAWMNLGPDGAAALAKRWANVDSATAGYVARLWLGAQKKWDRVSADGIFSVLNAFQVSEARDAAIQAIPGAAYERMDSDFIAAILSLVSAHGNNHWGRKIYAAIPGDAWKRIGHADMATLVRRWASVDSATAGYVMRLWIAAQSAAK